MADFHIDSTSGWDPTSRPGSLKDDRDIPQWLLQVCIKARETYGCNWVLLDPDGDVIPDLPTYDH